MKKAKGARGKADALASEIVRSRGACQRCGSTSSLQCAHIISRTYSATRSDIDNLLCLCAGCHMHFHRWPLDFAEFVEAKIGAEKYQALKLKAQAVTKLDWDEEVIRLKEIKSRLVS